MNIGVLGVHRDGGMCARIAMPAQNLIDATGLTAHQAALVEFLAIGAHAVRRSEMTPADRVLVTGAGPIGIGAALFARALGAEVHVMDTSDQRLASAGRMGFTHLHQPATLPEGGFDVVMDATGNPKAMEAGFAHVAHGGTYVLVSVVKDDLTFNDAEFHKREMRLIGSRNAVAVDFQTVMAALASGAVDSDALISTTLPLADLPRRIGELSADRGGIIKALVEIAPQAT
jgi:2-desacetyl-2-hydroxyethyl bacteriochlorophyllide A dehydrogenase